MEVRCERCQARHAIDDGLVAGAGVAIRCSKCGHLFRVGRGAGGGLRPAPGAGTRRAAGGQLRRPDGGTRAFEDLATVQTWIVEGLASRDDELSHAGGPWIRLGSIQELEPFFAVTEKARRAALAVDLGDETEPAVERSLAGAAAHAEPGRGERAGPGREVVPFDTGREPVAGRLDETPTDDWEVPAPASAAPGAEPAWAEQGAPRLPAAGREGRDGRRGSPAATRSRTPWVLVALVLALAAAAAAAYLMRPAWLPLELVGLSRPISTPAPVASEMAPAPAPTAAVPTPAPAPAEPAPTPTPAPAAASPGPEPAVAQGPTPSAAGPAAPAPAGEAAPPGAPAQPPAAGATAPAAQPTPSEVAPQPAEGVVVAPQPAEPQQQAAGPQAPDAAGAAAPTEPAGSPPRPAPAAEQERGAEATPTGGEASAGPRPGGDRPPEIGRRQEQGPGSSDAAPEPEPSRAPSTARPAATQPSASAPPPPAKAARPRPTAPRGIKGLLADARRLRERGRAEAALATYARAVELDPSDADALAGRGLCYLDLSQYAPAEASFKAALDFDPRNGAALMGLAETYRYEGRRAEAVTYYRRFLAAHPSGEEAVAARKAISSLEE